MSKSSKILVLICIGFIAFSCVGSKRKFKDYEKTDSLSITNERIKENKEVFTETNETRETVIIKEFDDTLQASIYIDSLQSDTIESSGVKIIAKTTIVNGKLKTKITAISKPKKVIESNKHQIKKDSLIIENKEVKKDVKTVSDYKSKSNQIDKKVYSFPWWIWILIILVLGYMILRLYKIRQ